MKTHNVKVTPEQHRQLLALQETWQTQRLTIIAGTQPIITEIPNDL